MDSPPDDPLSPSASTTVSDALAKSADPKNVADTAPAPVKDKDGDGDTDGDGAIAAVQEFPAPPVLSPPPRSPPTLASASAAAALLIYGPTPLETGRLRLLTVQPGTAPSPLILTLSTHKLVSQPQYEALSHASDQPPTQRCRAVRLDGRAYPISPSLMSALMHLRRSRQPRTLWVESLCVNPFSAVERGFQAAQLAPVFRGASRVLAWLGPGTVENAAALDAIAQVVKAPRAHWYAAGHRDSDRLDRRDPSVGKADWIRGLRDVVTGPWWSALGTLAEAVLARDLAFLLGPRSLPLESLFRACESWSYHAARKRCCPLTLDALRAGMGNVTRLELRRAKWRQAKRVDMDLLRRQVALVEAKPLPDPTGRGRHVSLAANRAHAERYEFLRDAHDTLMKRYAEFLASSPEEGGAGGEDRRRVEREFFRVRDRLRNCALDLLDERDAQRRALFAAASASDRVRLEQREAAVWADLRGLADECRARGCADPRDRVYGLSALRSHLFQQAPLLDYVFPAEKVWEDLQLEMMRRSRSLDVLALLGPRNVKRAVSWAVDWAAPANPVRDANTALLRERQEYAARWAACGGEASRVTFVHPRALSLGGFAIGRVSKVGLSHLVADGEMAWFKYREWWEALELDRLPMPTDAGGRSMEEVLCEVIMSCSSTRPAGVARNGRAFQEQLLANIRAYRTRKNNPGTKGAGPEGQQQSWLKRSATLRRNGSKSSVQAPPPAPVAAAPAPAPTIDLLTHAMRATIGRQLVVSDSGHVCLAPTGVQRGDELCVLYGGRTPLVLRQAELDPDGYGDRPLYRIVGDAYVHGVMGGEAVRAFAERGEELPDTEFLII
jgi:hypothetical protein